MTRTILALIASPILAATGFRFSKEYRWGVTRFHRAVFAMVDTVRANTLANAMRPQGRVIHVLVEV